MNIDSFGILTEFAVALAGFAGVAAVLSNRGDSFDPIAWIRTLALLSWAMGAAFASVLPLLGASYGVLGSQLWARCSFAFVPVLVGQVAVLVISARRLTPTERALLATYMWVLAIGGNVLVAIWQLSNALRLHGDASPGPLVGGIVWVLAFSALNFVRMIVKLVDTRAA